MLLPARRFAAIAFSLAASCVLLPIARADDGPAIDGRPVAKWLDLLAHGDDHERTLAMKALGKGGKAVVPPLVALLKGDDARTGAWAAETLGLVGEGAVEAADALAAGLLRDGMDWPCAFALERLGAPGVPGLVAGLAGERQGTRMAALVSLSKVGEALPASALPALRKTVADSDAEVRGATASCLSRIAVAPAIRLAVLAPLVADPSPDVRSQVVSALVAAAGGEPASVLPLALLSGDPDYGIRAAATTALSKVPRGEGDDDVVANALARGLADLDEHVRVAAIAGVVDGALVDGVLGERVRAIEGDPSARVRAEVVRVWGFSRAPDAEVRKRVETAFCDPDAIVRVVAAAAMVRRGYDVKRGLDFLLGEEGIYHGLETVRDAVVRSMGDLGPASAEARARLEKITTDPAAEIRAAAQNALRRLDEAAARATKATPPK